MMLFKKENNSLNERRGFPKAAVVPNNDIFELNINIYIYTFKFHDFYIIEKRKASSIICEIMRYLCL